LCFTDINGTEKAVEVPTSQLDKVLTNDIRLTVLQLMALFVLKKVTWFYTLTFNLVSIAMG
jgi:hypothetical protein